MEILIPFIIVGIVAWTLFGMMFTLECLLLEEDEEYTLKRILKTLCFAPLCGPLATLIMCIDIIRNIAAKGNIGKRIRAWVNS